MSHNLLLNLKNSTCGYASQKVVQDLDLYLNARDIGYLLGPSGCGKTTILCAITGFEPMPVGRIELGGRVTSRPSFTLAPEKRRTGMVFQDYTLFPHLSVADGVGFGIRKHPQRERLVRELLELVKLDHLATHRPYGLSGGQQQRVTLARTLVPEPLLLLLDEPLSNLDVELRRSLGQEVREILKACGAGAILVTHDQEEALAVCDHIGVFGEGHLEQWDTPYSLYHEPLTPFVASSVGQDHFIHGQLFSPDTMQAELGAICGNRAYSLSSGSAVDVLLCSNDLVHAPQGKLKARIIGRTFLGAAILYRLQLPTGTQSESIFPSHANHQPDDGVGIRVIADHLVVFTARGDVAARLAPVQA